MFKTQAEIYQALLNGDWLKQALWKDGEFVYLGKGILLDERGQSPNISFFKPQDWSIVEKPKPPRKLYAFIKKPFEIMFSPLEKLSVSHSWWERAPEFDIEYKD